MNKPVVAGKTPQMVDIENGKTYAWCACGLSVNQPWCNGAHKKSDFSPNVFKCEESKKAAMCMCKLTKNPPYCDGSHKQLND